MLAAFGPMAAWFVEAFPPMVRYSGVGMGYNFSHACFGGTAPLIATALIGAGYQLGPMFWVSFVALVSMAGPPCSSGGILALRDTFSTLAMSGAG